MEKTCTGLVVGDVVRGGCTLLRGHDVAVRVTVESVVFSPT